MTKQTTQQIQRKITNLLKPIRNYNYFNLQHWIMGGNCIIPCIHPQNIYYIDGTAEYFQKKLTKARKLAENIQDKKTRQGQIRRINKTRKQVFTDLVEEACKPALEFYSIGVPKIYEGGDIETTSKCIEISNKYAEVAGINIDDVCQTFFRLGHYRKSRNYFLDFFYEYRSECVYQAIKSDIDLGDEYRIYFMRKHFNISFEYFNKYISLREEYFSQIEVNDSESEELSLGKTIVDYFTQIQNTTLIHHDGLVKFLVLYPERSDLLKDAELIMELADYMHRDLFPKFAKLISKNN